jgi:UDP-N-acetylglucosamine--N-acetylmuramyl-(pentapeptide) pyrophosphoryl-undecaprenol N-acetylglucosamine transferase
MNKIIFAAGGTGGHIYPAISIADELKIIKKDLEILFIGAKGRVEEKIIPDNGYQLETLDITGFKRKINYQNIVVLKKLYTAINRSKYIINSFKPDLVYGTGGFVSGPVLWAASRSNVSSIIQNGDYYPGLTTRLVASKVSKIILNFKESAAFFKNKKKLEYFSYPVRQTLDRIKREDALTLFELSPEYMTILIVGGSQGSASINSAIEHIIKKLTDNNIQIIWQTGVSDYERTKKITGNNKKCKVLEYITNMGVAYSACSMAICRAGISTIMELASFGVPALFVPYPFASSNHQEKNASRLVDAKAADMIHDRDLELFLYDKIVAMLGNDQLLNEYKNNIRNFADDTAANKIANYLLNNF